MARLLLFSFFVAGIAGLYFLAGFLLTVLNYYQIPANALDYFRNSIIIFSIAFAMAATDLYLIYLYHKHTPVRFSPIKKPRVSVAMTAYNDEIAIGKAVRDFKKLKEVIQVIVIDNNCTDNTAVVAKRAGAKVIKEPIQGYGASCIRGLTEASKKGNVICLVEGDQTYSAADLKKFLSYLENGDLVVGTRTTAEIIAPDSQVSNFLRYLNVLGAKFIQLRFWEKLRLTDVGCTFRVIRPQALKKILPKLKVTGNAFSPHMILEALKANLKVIEIPVTFHKRAGVSKGVGTNLFKAFTTGLEMLWLIMVS